MVAIWTATAINLPIDTAFYRDTGTRALESRKDTKVSSPAQGDTSYDYTLRVGDALSLSPVGCSSRDLHTLDADRMYFTLLVVALLLPDLNPNLGREGARY